MDIPVTVTLPGGLWLDGACHREAVLRPLTGADEAFLAEAGEGLQPAQWTTAVLARCLARLGPLAPVDAGAVRALSAGDREALLLHVRRLTLGDRLPCVLECPECGEKLEWELQCGDLLLPPASRAASGPWHTATLEEGDHTYRVRFRVPNGEDQEWVAERARAARSQAGGSAEEAESRIAEELLQRCVQPVVDEAGAEVDWPPGLAERLPGWMADRDPQAELLLSLRCPACGQEANVLFDVRAYFAQELAGRARQLYREVHRLALAYHWSEAEILGMTARKRLLYLELLQEEEGR